MNNRFGFYFTNSKNTNNNINNNNVNNNIKNLIMMSNINANKNTINLNLRPNKTKTIPPPQPAIIKSTVAFMNLGALMTSKPCGSCGSK